MKGNRGCGNREGGFDLLTPQHALELAGKSVYAHFRENGTFLGYDILQPMQFLAVKPMDL